MAEAALSRLWVKRGKYLLLSLAVILLHLLPLSTLPQRWPPPDVLFALTYAWAVRRPEHVPSVLLAAVFLLADLLLQRPPGLWAALVLVVLEWTKSRERQMAENTFALEWVTFGGLLILMTLIYRAILLIMAVTPGPMFLASLQVGFTIAAYPLVVLAARFIFGIRRASPGEMDRGR